MTDKIDDENETNKESEDEFGEEFDFESDIDTTPEEEEVEPGEFEEQFEELEGSEEFETLEEEALEEEPEISGAPKHRSMLLPLLIGVGIVGFIGWKVYGLLTTPKKLETEIAATEPKEIPQTPMTTYPGAPAEMPKLEQGPGIEEPKREPEAPTAQATPSPTQPAISQTPLSTAPSVPEPAPSSATLTIPPAPVPAPKPQLQPQALPAQSEMLSVVQKKLEEQEKVFKQQIQTLEDELSSSAKSAESTNKNLTLLQNQIGELSSLVENLSSDIKALRKEREKIIIKQEEPKVVHKKIVKHIKQETFASPSLIVHAIIPGRAWLRCIDGKTITVTEGDSLGEYGRVLRIDAPNGVVVTTSGVTLR